MSSHRPHDPYAIPSVSSDAPAPPSDGIDYYAYFRALCAGLHPFTHVVVLDRDGAVQMDEPAETIAIHTYIDIAYTKTRWVARVEQTYTCGVLVTQTVMFGTAVDLFYWLLHDFAILNLYPHKPKAPDAWISDIQCVLERSNTVTSVRRARARTWAAARRVDEEQTKCCAVQ
jgi:hypothetical protein